MIEFNCAKCGVRVFAYGLTEPPPAAQRCGMCQLIDAIADPAERERVRGFLDRTNRTEIEHEPYYWKNEIGGVLKPAVEAFLAGGELDAAQIAALRAYCRQWVMAKVWDRNPHAGAEDGVLLAELRADVGTLFSRAAIEAWLERASDQGLDPL